MHYDHIAVPEDGERITINNDHSLNVPERPIVPYIEGDGIGIDVTPVMLAVTDAAVQRAYGDKRAIAWMQVYAGEKATEVYGENEYLPEETLQALRDFVVSIKGPLTTPVGGGFRSLNVTIRQTMDLFACVRPIRYFPGVITPMKESDLVNMVVFRENTEGHLRRHRVPHRFAGSAKAHQLPAGRAPGRHEDPLPGELGHRHQAGFERRFAASGAQSHPVLHRSRLRLGVFGAQRQHHEVHRGRVSRMGLSAREGRVRRGRERRRAVARVSTTRAPAKRSSSRT